METIQTQTHVSPGVARIALYMLVGIMLVMGGCIAYQASIIQGQRHLIIKLYKDAWGQHTASAPTNGRV